MFQKQKKKCWLSPILKLGEKNQVRVLFFNQFSNSFNSIWKIFKKMIADKVVKKILNRKEYANYP